MSESDKNLAAPTAETALYRAFRSDGALLYVGISVSVLARFQTHTRRSPWSGAVARLEVQRFPNRASALEAERQAIIRERPLANIVYAGRPRRTTIISEDPVAPLADDTKRRPLTEIQIERATLPPELSERVLWDPSTTGFGVRIRRGGPKCYVVMYRTTTGRQRKMTLGPFRLSTLKKVRKKARQLLAEAGLGRDPAAEKQSERRAVR